MTKTHTIYILPFAFILLSNRALASPCKLPRYTKAAGVPARVKGEVTPTMEEKPMKRHTMLVVITLILAGMLSCSSGDTATVTIDTGIRKQAQLSMLDKLIAWITFSQAVKADQPPSELYGNIKSIEVTISASDMGTITEVIPKETGRITLEVPAGSQRTFEVVAIDPDNRRYYGGIATVDLSAGQQVALNIEMGELNNKFGYFYYYTEYKYMDSEYPNTDDPTLGVIAFRIYESDDYLYTNEKLKFVVTSWGKEFIEDVTVLWVITIPIELPDIGTKYYRVAVVNQYGEGEKVEITQF